jgi:hypothetical protein
MCSADNDDLLNLFDRHGVARSVIELCRARRFMRRHPLRVLEQAAVFHIRRDAGCAEHVATGVSAQPRRQRAAADHPKDFNSREAARRELTAASA